MLRVCYPTRPRHRHLPSTRVMRSQQEWGPWLLIATWLMGGGLALVGALCYAELATIFPETGGDYVFLSKAFGRYTGFAFAWVEFWIVRPGNVGALAYVFGRYAQQLQPLGTGWFGSMAYAVIAVVFPDRRQHERTAQQQAHAECADGRQSCRIVGDHPHGTLLPYTGADFDTGAKQLAGQLHAGHDSSHLHFRRLERYGTGQRRSPTSSAKICSGRWFGAQES